MEKGWETDVMCLTNLPPKATTSVGLPDGLDLERGLPEDPSSPTLNTSLAATLQLHGFS